MEINARTYIFLTTIGIAEYRDKQREILYYGRHNAIRFYRGKMCAPKRVADRFNK